MTYNLALVGDPDRAVLAAALAEIAGVPVGDVDVADADDTADRNWAAAVSCTCERLGGDLAWQLDVYFTDAVAARPAESAVAAAVAERLGMPVLYPAEEPLPSAYWVTGGGSRTRARVSDGYTIDAVEAPVPGLPGVPIARQPEVIREYPLSRPVAEEFAAWLATIGGADAEPVWFARTRLDAWERLAVRMGSGWPPDGWYPVEFYREDLEIRDELATVAQRLPDGIAARFTAALTRVDEAFRAATVDAGDRNPFDLSAIDLALRGWWWRRRPEPVPWPR